MVTIKILNDPNELKNNCNRTNFQKARVLEEAIKKAISEGIPCENIRIVVGKGIYQHTYACRFTPSSEITLSDVDFRMIE